MAWELDYARATGAQSELHRPSLGPDFLPAAHGLENQLTVIWALEGAVLLRYVPGSHRWPLGRVPNASAAVELHLNAGDSVVCASGMWRATGSSNTSGNTSGPLALEVGYHLSFWQTEEENQMAIGSPRAGKHTCNPHRKLDPQGYV